ncbi:plasmid partitioning protein RepB [Methylosinus sp. H3A]|uniref:plasmid partitioning protein RepB n=1 Tax=Hyphomicrobiales TaxID=356 RepID=UPI0018C1E611|nr:plasmid partitioning protein RepB [Methylosinus sp. H3A]MBG0808164.1 plasmid partitioning protein RepB [Methylosinus sp. H3A]
MTKREPRKSIIANFGSLLSDQPGSSAGSTAESSVGGRTVARVGAGVIGATQRTLTDIREERDRLRAQLESGSGLEVDPDLIEPSPFPDRLPDDSEEDFETFKRQIEDEGQKIPIQVRRHPGSPGRYQVVYGHRRWRAAKELGRPLKCMIVDYSDSELVVAQGIENAARQDLTWIERALFAWRMDAAGIKARDIRAALGIDDPELARFRSVCRAIPEGILEAIGRAPKVGRPRWVELAAALTADPSGLAKIEKTLAADKVLGTRSDDRFRIVLGALKASSAEQGRDVQLLAKSGRAIGKATFKGGDIRFSLAREHSEAFSEFLRGEIPHIVERFLAREEEA